MSTAVERTVLITGATDGVGTLVAKRLAAAGSEVILHGRNDKKGRNTIQEIRRDTSNARVDFRRADCAVLEDVRQLAREVTKAHEHINLLINNAGIGFAAPGAARETSRDGYELRFAVNYLAPFLLTHLLLPTIRRSAPARIINVASIGQAPIDFDDVMLTRHYDGRRAYAQSKLALVMFTLDLAAALQGTGVTANAIHPATLMNTKMVSEAGIRPHSTVEEGADAILYLATSSDLDSVSGRFFEGRRESRPLDAAYDPTGRRKLRQLTLDLTGVSRAGTDGRWGARGQTRHSLSVHGKGRNL